MKIGTLGLSKDLAVLFRTSCYKQEGGHGVEVEAKGTGIYREDSPFDPTCRTCRQLARTVLLGREIPEETVRHYFELVGAKWDWKEAPSDRPVERLGIEDQQLLGRSYVEARASRPTPDRRRERQSIEHEEALAFFNECKGGSK